MKEQKLELLLKDVRPQTEVRQYADTIDVMADGYVDMDCRHTQSNYDCINCSAEMRFHNDMKMKFHGDMMENNFDRPLLPEPINDRYFPTSNGYGIMHKMNDFDESGDFHDTYSVDRYDKHYDSHSTFRKKSGKSILLNHHQDIDDWD